MKTDAAYLTLFCLQDDVCQTQSTVAIKSGSSLPFCNRAYIGAMCDHAELASVQTFYANTPYTLWVNAYHNDIKERLLAHGYIFVKRLPLMMAHVNELTITTVDTRISVECITSSKDILTTWIPIVIKAYNPAARATEFEQMAHEWQSFFYYLKGTQSYDRMRFFLGYWDGIPAASGFFVSHDDAVYIHWIGTLPHMRGRGLGNAITRLPLQEYEKNGVQRAFLFASEMGRPIYKKIGFQDIEHYDVYKKSPREKSKLIA